MILRLIRQYDPNAIALLDNITISNGSIDNSVVARENSEIYVSGGSVGDLYVWDSGVMTIYGDNFNYGIGPITTNSGVLTGTLANGIAINSNFYINDTASIILAPEPATLLLLGLGAVMLRGKRGAKQL